MHLSSAACTIRNARMHVYVYRAQLHKTRIYPQAIAHPSTHMHICTHARTRTLAVALARAHTHRLSAHTHTLTPTRLIHMNTQTYILLPSTQKHARTHTRVHNTHTHTITPTQRDTGSGDVLSVTFPGLMFKTGDIVYLGMLIPDSPRTTGVPAGVVVCMCGPPCECAFASRLIPSLSSRSPVPFPFRFGILPSNVFQQERKMLNGK